MKKKILALTLASSMALAAFSGCAKKEDTAQGGGGDILIGTAFEQSGAVASYGNANLDGVRFAIKEINAAGGVNGKQLKLVEVDSKSEESEATNAVTRLATKDQVVAILGPATSGLTQAGIAPANESKVPLISPSATDDKALLDADGNVQPYGFRLCFQDSFQGVTMANFASQNLKAQKAVILGDNSSDYALGLAKNFEEKFTGEIVSKESYTKGDKDFNAVLTNLKNKEFDVMFVPGYYEEVGLIIKQARALGMTQPIIGGDGFDSPELLNIAGADALSDVYFSSHYSVLNSDDKTKAFIDAFKAEYGREPNAFNALAYDSAYMLADALGRAESLSGEHVKQALEATSGFAGVTGTVSVDDKHNAIKSASVIKLEKGKQVESTIVQP